MDLEYIMTFGRYIPAYFYEYDNGMRSCFIVFHPKRPHEMSLQIVAFSNRQVYEAFQQWAEALIKDGKIWYTLF